MRIHDNILIAECSSYDFNEMLERKKVKPWLKSVSAFANTDGGSLFYGVNDDGEKFGVKGEEASKRVSGTGQKIIDLVISDSSITAEAMSVKIGVSKRAVERTSKSSVRGASLSMKVLIKQAIGAS